MPRSGNAGDPDEGMGTNRDLAGVGASYDPAAGRLDLAVRFHQPVAAEPRGTVEAYFREDRGAACDSVGREVRMRFVPDPGRDGVSETQVASADLGEGAFAEKRTSADGREVTTTFTDSRLAGADFRCVFVQTTGPFTGDPTFVPPVFDRQEPPLHFDGFAPDDVREPVLTVKSASAQRTGRTGRLALTATSDEAGTLEAIAGVTVARRRLRFRPAVATVRPGTPTRLVLRLGRSSLAKVRAALADGKRLTARVEVTAEDAAGNSSSRVRRIRLKP